MSTKKTAPKKPAKNTTPAGKPKLSKAGEFMRKHPEGFIKIIDYKAVMK